MIVKDKIKLLAGLDRRILSDCIPLETPFSIYVFPTNFCNLHCMYCAHSLHADAFFDQYGFKPENMGMDTYRMIIDQLTEFPDRVHTLSLTGQGEPLLNPYLANMVEYAKKRDVTERIEFMSNGILLTEEKSRALIDAGLDGIRISIQGLTAKKYKQVCGVEIDYKKFLDQIGWLYEHRQQCEVFIKIIDLALEYGKEADFYKTFSPIADRIYIERCKPVYEGVEATRQMNVMTDRYGREHPHRKVCPLCFYMLGIFPNGDVFPCEAIYRPVLLGNIHDDSLYDIWTGKKLHDFWRAQLRGERDTHSICSKCCAPDDVSHPEDVLDEQAERIQKRIWQL